MVYHSHLLDYMLLFLYVIASDRYLYDLQHKFHTTYIYGLALKQITYQTATPNHEKG